MKEREELTRAEAELTEAEAAIEAAKAKYLETGEEKDAKAIRAARDRAEIAELRVQRSKTMLARAEEAATAAAKEARRARYQKGRPSIEAILAKEEPLIEAEAKLLLQLVDVRVARKAVRAEAKTAIAEWKPLYLEFDPAIAISEHAQRMVANGDWDLEKAMEWTDPAAFRQNPWLSFDVDPDPQPVIDAARNAVKLVTQPGKADPRGALLDRVLPSPGDYQLPYPPQVNGLYLEWLACSEVPPFVEKKGIVGSLFK